MTHKQKLDLANLAIDKCEKKHDYKKPPDMLCPHCVVELIGVVQEAAAIIALDVGQQGGRSAQTTAEEIAEQIRARSK